MKKYTLLYFLVLFTMTCFLVGEDEKISREDENEDNFIWLEEVDGEESLAWVKKHNEATLDILQQHPGFTKIYDANINVYNSKERIIYPSLRANYIYHFLQDEDHVKGLWRRTTIDSYESENVEWESLLDIDALSKEENESWVFKGSAGLEPDYNHHMIMLSRGGGDAVVIREYDVNNKKFVENGFSLPEAKGSVSWFDKDHLVVSTNFGEGSTTSSGYPRIVKLWKRGQPLEDAKVLFEGEKNDVGTWGGVVHTPERNYLLISRAMTFYTYHRYVLEDDKVVKLPIPDNAQLAGFFKDDALVELKSDWTVGEKTYSQGSLLAINYQKLLQDEYEISLITAPTDKSSIASITTFRNYLLINESVNVSNKLYKYFIQDGNWTKEVLDIQDFGNISVVSAEADKDIFFFTYQNFLTPTSLYKATEGGKKIKLVKSLPKFFADEKFKVDQLEATSKDGTKIPYFIVYPKDVKLDGKSPTLLYGYGGFEVPLYPSYSATIGVSWLNEGGIYILANIRGGGEFGPKWHHAALKENRQRAYDDFIAVAEDAIKRKYTSPKHLGIMGGSNGGLLVGVAFTQRPDLFNAVVCRVPLLDMKRFNKLLAGASWMGEYGNPDIPEEWEYIRKYSPYQNLSKDKKYPKVFFNTSTRDDRVHPGHARKMVAKMESMGHPVFYYENMEGGHAAATTNDQRAFANALMYAYLLQQLK